MNRRFFTLIELLVLVVVIGILAAVLLPTLDRSKAAAKRIHCSGNVRQLALAVHLYAEDHEDYPPPYHLQDTRLERLGVPRSIVWNSLLLNDYLNRDTNIFQRLGNFGLKSVLHKVNSIPPYLFISFVKELIRVFLIAQSH